MKKPACASKQDVLELATLLYDKHCALSKMGKPLRGHARRMYVIPKALIN